MKSVVIHYSVRVSRLPVSSHRMRAARFLGAIVIAVGSILAGCSGSRPPTPTNLPPPVMLTNVGPGDVLEVYVVGEKDLPKEFHVDADGGINYPYIPSRLNLTGLEPQAVAALIKQGLIDAQYLRAPQVSVSVTRYNSKAITIVGQIAKPGSVPYTQGLHIVKAISDAGWFTPLADSNHVLLTRIVPKGTVTAVISVDAISEGKQPDIPLQAGDTINVGQSMFGR